MSAPKIGDRVRAVRELTGRVTSINGAYAEFMLEDVGYHDCASLPLHVLSVIRPPVKVGDVIDTAEQLDALPEGTIVLGPEGEAWRLTELIISGARVWRSTGAHYPLVALPATVLYLPDGAA